MTTFKPGAASISLVQKRSVTHCFFEKSRVWSA
jgi:hypothetical protein